jgi:hypothetical protein
MRKQQTIAEPVPLPARRRLQFSLLALLGLLSLLAIVLAACSNLWRVPRVQDRLNLALRVEGVYVDGERLTDEQLERRLTEFHGQWERWCKLYVPNTIEEGGPEPPVIRLAASDGVTFRQVFVLLRKCSAAELHVLELQHGGRTRKFAFTSYTPSGAIVCGPESSFRASITADHEGKLARIDVDERPLLLKALNDMALAYFADWRSFDTLITCDGGLRLSQWLDVVTAISTRAHPDGSSVPLIPHLTFVDPEEKAPQQGEDDVRVRLAIVETFPDAAR